MNIITESKALPIIDIDFEEVHIEGQACYMSKSPWAVKIYKRVMNAFPKYRAFNMVKRLKLRK